MQNTKLIQLLKSFNATEFRDFRDYVKSPVFNKNKNVIVLLDTIRKFYPGFTSNSLNDESVYKKIFPGEKYDYFKIKNIISDLFSLGKNFLAFIQFRDFSNVKEKFLLEQLRDRSLYSFFEQSYKIFKKKSDNTIVKDENYFFNCLELTEELHSFQIPKDPNSRLDFFQKELDYFLKYSVIRLLKFYTLMLHEEEMYNCSFNMRMFDEVMQYLHTNKDENNPTILIYYYFILLSKEKDEKYFFELKKLKDKYFDVLNNLEQYMIFLHMAAYCAYVYNNLGKKNFMYEHFLLSKENFDRGSIVLGKILYPDFLNHVKIAVRVDEFEWAENYIEKYKQQLTEEKENTLNFCFGFINYKKGNLDDALELLSRANFQNSIIKIQVKILLLQIYYEKEFYEQAVLMIDSFRHFLLRENSLVEESKKSFYDFLRITNEMIKTKMKINSGEKIYSIKKIKDDLGKLKFNQFGIKNWLELKADEL